MLAFFRQSGVTKATKEQFRKAEGPIIGFIVETEVVKRAALGIPFLSASLLLDRAMQSCEKLAADEKAASWALTVKAFDATVIGTDGGLDSGPMPALARLREARVP